MAHYSYKDFWDGGDDPSPEPEKARKKFGMMTDKEWEEFQAEESSGGTAEEAKEKEDDFWDRWTAKYDRKYDPKKPYSSAERYDSKSGKWEAIDRDKETPAQGQLYSHYTGYGNYDPSKPYVYTPYVPKPKTSEDNPIDVDFFPQWAVPTAGKLGMTFAPGKTQEKGLTGDHKRDIDKDLTRMIEFYGMDTLVTLNETKELEALKIADLREQCHSRGVGTIWYPFADMTAPPKIDHADMLVDMIVEKLNAGENVIVHCKGGLGRTGCIAGCVLVRLGFRPSEAILTVRAVRPFTIQMTSQENFIYRYWWFNDNR